MADKLLNLEIVTPEKKIYSDDVLSVTVPGSKSPFQVLFNHAPIVSSLDMGIIKVVDKSQKAIYFASSPGFTEVRKNKVSILVESAEEATQIDITQVNTLLLEAKEKLKGASSSEEIQQAKLRIKSAENLLKTVQKLNG